MLTTSVSLPDAAAKEWRQNQRSIMRTAIRTLRIFLRRNPVRRGVTRRYNTACGAYQIVTTRFTEAEYDTLHFAASAMRLSVSSLVWFMVKLWLKSSRRRRWNKFLTNYELYSCNWSRFAGVVTESLLFYPKIFTDDIAPPEKNPRSLLS